MRKFLAALLALALLSNVATAQEIRLSQDDDDDDEVVRITSELVQTDVVVVDRNDRPVTDIKLEEFEVYDNGKRQELKFMEFVSAETGRRTEGQRPAGMPAGLPPSEASSKGELTAAELKRVFAFVVDDLTIPFEDMATVRRVLTDFVDNQMRPGDLVAIVRVVGGKGLLQQFTSDKEMLRRAISQLSVTPHNFSAFNNPQFARLRPSELAPESDFNFDTAEALGELGDSLMTDGSRLLRSLMSLTTANYVIDGLGRVPGRKNLVLFSGGLPIFQAGVSGNIISTVSYMMRQLTDNAARAGVAISTMDVQGLDASPAVARFTDTPASSALGAGRPGEGRLPDGSVTGAHLPFSQLEGQLGLRALANDTGGVAVLNTNDFKKGLDNVINRGSSYYLLAYTPTQRFDEKFHKLQVKVKREGVKVYTRAGYIAREEARGAGARTRQEAIMAAAASPLARRDIDVAANIVLKPLASNKTEVGIHLLVDAKKLSFKQAGDKQQAAFEVAGFIVDELGRTRGGFSETIKLDLSPENYKRALETGLTYSATTELPPGPFQLRAVVRDEASGALGTISRFMEMPDLSKGRLTMSSLFLFAVDPKQGAAPEPLLAQRRVRPTQDLRYAAIVYNPKLSKGAPQLTSQLVISQGEQVVHREPAQPIPPPASADTPIIKLGQFGVSKMRPGRYVLTLIITDTLADKKNQIISRSMDFTVAP